MYLDQCINSAHAQMHLCVLNFWYIQVQRLQGALHCVGPGAKINHGKKFMQMRLCKYYKKRKGKRPTFLQWILRNGFGYPHPRQIGMNLLARVTN